MNEEMARVAEGQGFKCDGDCFYGTLNGYQVSGKYAKTSASVGVSVALTPEQTESVRRLAMGIAMRYPGSHRVSTSSRGVSATFPVGNGTPLRMIVFITEVIASFSTFTNGAACPICGGAMEDDTCLVEAEGRRFIAHETCFDKYADGVLRVQADNEPTGSDTIRGVAGALTGAVLGGLAWILLSLIGLFSLAAAFFIPVFSAFFWDKFGGKGHIGKIVTMWIAAAAVLAVSIIGAYCFAVYLALSNAGISGNVFNFFIYMMRSDAEFNLNVWLNIALSYLILIAAGLFMTFRIIRKKKMQENNLKKFK